MQGMLEKKSGLIQHGGRWAVLLALLTLLALRPAGAVEKPAQLLGQCGGTIQAIATQGHYAYIGEGMGLVTLDIADPQKPVRLAKLMMPRVQRVNERVRGVAVSGNFVYAVYGRYLQVIDVTDPAAPRLRGECVNFGSGLQAVTVAGTYAYVASGLDGVNIVDISDPDQPSRSWIEGHVDTPDFASDVAVAGNTVYAAVWGKGVQMIGATTPKHPVLKGVCDTPGAALKLALSGQTLYVADQMKGVAVFDVTPTTPTLKWTIRTGDAALDVKTSGSLVAVACRGQGVKLYDASQPTTPTLIGTADTPGQARALAVNGDTVCVADETGLQLADASQPASPVLVGGYQPPVYATDMAMSWDQLTKRNWGFVASETGLGVIDLANPRQPVQQMQYPMPAPAKCLAILNPGRDVETFAPVPPPYVLVSDVAGVYQRPGARGLWIFNATKPNAPTLVANYQPAGEIEKIVAYGASGYKALALLAEGSKGLELVDVTTPTTPTHRGTFLTTGTVTDVAAASPTTLAVAAGPGGLKIVDITNPTSPTLLKSYYGAGEVYGVDSYGNRVIVAGRSRLQVLDLSTPTSPTVVRSYNHNGWSKVSNVVLGQLLQGNSLSSSVFLTDDGDYLQTADPNPGTQLAGTPLPIDPAYDPNLPRATNKYLLGGESSALVIDGDHQLAFDADNDGGGLIVLGLGDLKNAVKLDWTKFD